MDGIRLKIRNLSNFEVNRTMFAFLCYKASVDIKRVLIAINFGKEFIYIVKNDYLIWPVSRIIQDLESLRVNFEINSDILLDISENFNVERIDNRVHIKTDAYLILEFGLPLPVDTVPIKYNEKIYKELYFYNDQDNFSALKTFTLDSSDKLANLLVVEKLAEFISYDVGKLGLAEQTIRLYTLKDEWQE